MCNVSSFFQSVHYQSIPGSPLYKVFDEVREYQLPVKIVDGRGWKHQHDTTNPCCQVSIVTDGSVPFTSFGTEPWNSTGGDRGKLIASVELMSSRYSESTELHQKLLARCETSKKLLQENEHFFMISQKNNDFKTAAKSCQDYMSRFDFTGEIQLAERRFQQVAGQVAKSEKLYRDLSSRMIDTPKSHHRSFEISKIEASALSMVKNTKQKYLRFNLDFQKHHGCRILESKYTKAGSDIRSLQSKLTCVQSYSNLNAIRLAQRNYQENKRSVGSLEITSNKLGSEYQDLAESIEEKNLSPSLVSVKESIENEMCSLIEASQQKGQELLSLYGIHGYMVDAEEAMAGLEQYEDLLKGIDVAKSLGEIQQRLALLQQLGGEFSHKMQIASDLIQHGSNMEKSMTSTAKAVHQKLVTCYQDVSSLEGAKTSQLNERKRVALNEKCVAKITKDLEGIDEAIIDFDLQRETLGVSYADLIKESDRLDGLLDLQHQRFENLGESQLEGSAHIQYRLEGTKKSLQELKENAADLELFERFTMKSGSFVELMQDGINRLKDAVKGIDAKNLRRRRKDLESANMFVQSLNSMKTEIQQQACGFLEDCHFASTQITDELEKIDTLWEQLTTTLEESNQKVLTLVKHNKLTARYNELADAQKQITKKLSNQCDIISLSSAKKSLSDTELLRKEIASKIGAVEDLLQDENTIGTDLHDVRQLLSDLQLNNKQCTALQHDRVLLCKYHSFIVQAHLEESWLIEKTALLEDIATPKTVTEALAISKALLISGGQINRHRGVLQSLLVAGEFCLNNDSRNCDAVNEKMVSLNKLSRRLNDMMEEKIIWIENQQKLLQCISNGDNHIEYIDTKLATVTERQYGTDLNSSEIAVQKHRRFKEELHSYKDQLKRFVREANHLRSQPEVKQLAQTVKNKYKKLEQCSSYREKMLNNSQQLFSLFSKADSLKKSMVDFNKTIPEDPNNGKQDEAVRHNDRLTLTEQNLESIRMAYTAFQGQCQQMVNQNPSAAENIAKVKSKIDTIYRKVSEKIDSRVRKSKRMLQYFEFINSLSNASERLEELQKAGNLLRVKSDALESIPALKEELRQSSFTLNETEMLKTKILNLTDGLTTISAEFPARSIEKFVQHLKALEMRYAECNKTVKESQTVLQTRISDLCFHSDVDHLRGWLSNAMHEIEAAVESALDDFSVSSSYSQVGVKCKEIEMKKRLLDDLQKTLLPTDKVTADKVIIKCLPSSSALFFIRNIFSVQILVDSYFNFQFNDFSQPQYAHNVISTFK